MPCVLFIDLSHWEGDRSSFNAPCVCTGDGDAQRLLQFRHFTVFPSSQPGASNLKRLLPPTQPNTKRTKRLAFGSPELRVVPVAGCTGWWSQVPLDCIVLPAPSQALCACGASSSTAEGTWGAVSFLYGHLVGSSNFIFWGETVGIFHSGPTKSFWLFAEGFTATKKSGAQWPWKCPRRVNRSSPLPLRPRRSNLDPFSVRFQFL